MLIVRHIFDRLISLVHYERHFLFFGRRILQQNHGWRVNDANGGDEKEHPGKADGGHNESAKCGTNRVAETEGNVGDGVDAAVDRRVSYVNQIAHGGHHRRVDHADGEAEPKVGQDEAVDALGEWHANQTDADDDQADHAAEPTAHAMGYAAKQIGANEIGDAGGQECGAQLPLLRVHRVHHPDGQRRLQHGNAHVGEGDGAGCRQNVRVFGQRFK